MCKVIKNVQMKKFLLVMSAIFCVNFLNQSPIRADLSNPTLPATVGESSGVAAAQGRVVAVEVDATDPANTQITYKLTKGTISVAKFFAPGIPNGVTRNSISQGNFSFTFNQNDVTTGSSNITLKYQLNGSSTLNTLTKSVSRTFESNSNSANIKAHTLLLNYRYFIHDLLERFGIITYSGIAIANNSRTIFGKDSHDTLYALDPYQKPNSYEAGHKYTASGNEYYLKNMQDGYGLPVIRDKDNWHLDKSVSTEKFLPKGAPSKGAVSISPYYYMNEGWVTATVNPDPVFVRLN